MALYRILMEFLLAIFCDLTLSRNRITMALIRLRRCAGWSASLLFVCNKIRFSLDEAHVFIIRWYTSQTPKLLHVSYGAWCSLFHATARLKSGNFRHRVISDKQLQIVEIQMRRLLMPSHQDSHCLLG